MRQPTGELRAFIAPIPSASLVRLVERRVAMETHEHDVVARLMHLALGTSSNLLVDESDDRNAAVERIVAMAELRLDGAGL
jgi:hypothetical protein